MLGAFQAHLADQLNEIRRQGLYKTERAVSTPQRAHIRTSDGKEVLNIFTLFSVFCKVKQFCVSLAQRGI
jgi:hypothetical protein